MYESITVFDNGMWVLGDRLVFGSANFCLLFSES